MREEEKAFLSAIAESSGDDTSRLVFADWLDEHDDPRAPLIRAEHKARTGPVHWRRATREMQSMGCHNISFVKGYGEVTISPADLLRFGEELTGEYGVRSVILTESDGNCDAPAVNGFESQPWLSRLNHLSTGHTNRHSAWNLLSSPHLDNLHSLVCEHLSPELNDLVARSPRFGKLSQVRIGPNRNAYGNIVAFTQALEDMASAPHLSGIRSLTLPGESIGQEQLCILARGTFGKSLETLHIERNINNEMLAALAHNAKYLTSLHTLHFDYPAAIDATGIRTLVESPLAAQLRHLHLGYIQGRDGSYNGVAELLAGQPALAGIQTLNLRGCHLSDPEVLTLAASPYLRPKTLDLSGSSMTGETLIALFESPLMQNVKYLRLPQMQHASLEQIRALSATPHAAHIESLEICPWHRENALEFIYVLPKLCRLYIHDSNQYMQKEYDAEHIATMRRRRQRMSQDWAARMAQNDNQQIHPTMQL